MFTIEREEGRTILASDTIVVAIAPAYQDGLDPRDENHMEELIEFAKKGYAGFEILWREGDMMARIEPLLDRG